ncbi:MAG: DUF3108 domain-containing protein [Pseudomonadota bacterium]
MWSKFFLLRGKCIWQDVSHQRLAIALGLSLLLHLFLIGKFYLHVPDLNEGRYLIEAQLVLSKPALPEPVLPEPVVAPVKAKPVARKPPVLRKDVVAKQAPPVPETPPAPEVPSLPAAAIESPQPALTATQGAIAQIKPTDAEPAAASIPEQLSTAINPNAYKYVETTFDVRTDIAASVDSSAPGKARIVYELLPNGEQYKINSLTEAKGLAALIIPDLLQTSDGSLINTGLQPKHYLYQFGSNKNKTFSADFDWEQMKLTLHSAKGDKTLDLVDSDGTQDLLSFMYQFMFSPPLQKLRFSITNGKRLGIYEYSFEGEEKILTKIGEINTIHLLRDTNESDEKTELWLALDYQYVPVKIRKTEKDGKVYELLVTGLKTEKPVTQSQQ